MKRFTIVDMVLACLIVASFAVIIIQQIALSDASDENYHLKARLRVSEVELDKCNTRKTTIF